MGFPSDYEFQLVRYKKAVESSCFYHIGEKFTFYVLTNCYEGAGGFLPSSDNNIGFAGAWVGQKDQLSYIFQPIGAQNNYVLKIFNGGTVVFEKDYYYSYDTSHPFTTLTKYDIDCSCPGGFKIICPGDAKGYCCINKSVIETNCAKLLKA